MKIFERSLLALFSMAVLLNSTPALAQIEVLPGSARRGEQLFDDKGCIRCHSIDGRGGSAAPDLARRSIRRYTPDLLASVMWNHGPEMWAAMAESGQNIPSLSSAETADLFSFFYSQLYFSIPGDAGRGRRVFVSRSCGACHDVRAPGDRSKAGPPVSSWARVRDPLAWAERMWNHSERMFETMQESSIPWPELAPQEMVDLLVYLRNLPSARSEMASFQPGEPEQGQALFESSCESCHSFGGPLQNRVDLLGRPGPRTLTGYATYMWNHAPLMRDAGTDPLPRLEDGSMTHLVAYLFARRYFSERGDAEDGRRIYAAKKCGTCHEQAREATGAPDLTQSTERYSPITMTRSLWNHGPAMLRALESRNLEWPVFDGDEMRDLIEFLNSRLVPRVAL